MVSEKAPTENLVRTAACRMMLDMAVRANGPDSGLASFEALARGEDDLSLYQVPLSAWQLGTHTERHGLAIASFERCYGCRALAQCARHDVRPRSSPDTCRHSILSSLSKASGPMIRKGELWAMAMGILRAISDFKDFSPGFHRQLAICE